LALKNWFITTIARGGAENQLKVLVREQMRCGFRVSILYLKGNPELAKDFLSLGADVDPRLHGKNVVFQLILLSRYLRNFNGVIHAHLPRAELISAITVRRQILIVSRHNAEQFFPSAPRFLSTLLSRYVEKRSTFVVAISNAVKKYLLESREIKDREKLKVVQYGYNSDLSKRVELVSKSSNSLFTIGTVARLTPQKDLPTLLRAFKSFKEKFPDTRLVIVGSGILERELKKLSIQLEISDSIKWLGRKSDIRAALEKMDLFVLPSKYEGFGLVLLEAIQAGTGVIAARNSAIPEVLGSDSDGLFTTGDFNELFQKLLKFHNKKERERLIKAQHSRLELFNPSLMISEMNKVYESAIVKQ